MNTGCLWYKRLYNPFTHNLGLEAQFEISDDKIGTKYDRTKNTNIKEGVNYVNRQVYKPDVKTFDLPGYNALQVFVFYSDEEEVTTKLFDILSLLEGTSIYFIYSEETKLFHPKEVQNVVSKINIRMGFFSVSNIFFPVEDIPEMHTFEGTLTEAERYNARVWCHYIAWDIKICLVI